eukprot:TRINITY_DN7785_c0_g2_i8.p1 TRINITY_DN7785_c0_g2~~TRINITY_DN7785_c0_g2_i8.p1  ORF type:complete len:381 (-),score=125.94 TRINITY_DN7785_c0_g2_i8:47-1087(-)
MKEPTEDPFINDILRNHNEKVKKIEESQKRQEEKKRKQEMAQSYLHAIRSKPVVDESLRYLQNKAVRIPSHRTAQRGPRKKAAKVVERPIDKVVQKRPLVKAKPPQVVKKRIITLEEKLEDKRINELTEVYYQNMDAGMPEELKMLLKRRESRNTKEEEEEYVILDWNTNKPIKKVKRRKGDPRPVTYNTVTAPAKPPPIQRLPKPAPQRDVQPKSLPMKSSVTNGYKADTKPRPKTVSIYTPIQRQTQKPATKRQETPEYEENSIDSFIEDDEGDERDQLAFRELQRMTGNYREKYKYSDDGDIPEAGFDAIVHEERITAHIGRKEDELEAVSYTHLTLPTTPYV